MCLGSAKYLVNESDKAFQSDDSQEWIIKYNRERYDPDSSSLARIIKIIEDCEEGLLTRKQVQILINKINKEYKKWNKQ